jgi:hypothetical protein
MHACQVGGLKLSCVNLSFLGVNTMHVKTMHACQVGVLESTRPGSSSEFNFTDSFVDLHLSCC